MGVTRQRADADLDILPTTTAGRVALGLLGIGILLVLARLVLTPIFGLPVSYLVMLVPTLAAGLLATYAMSRTSDRSVAVLATVVIGLLGASWLVAETLGGVSTITLDEGDNGRTVPMTAGNDVIVSLPGNPTTGYGWEVAIADPSVVKESQPVAYMASSSLVGSGGTYTFQYRTLKAGRTDITFVYRRSWETGVEPLKTYRITLAVS